MTIAETIHTIKKTVFIINIIYFNYHKEFRHLSTSQFEKMITTLIEKIYIYYTRLNLNTLTVFPRINMHALIFEDALCFRKHVHALIFKHKNIVRTIHALIFELEMTLIINKR